MSHEAKKKAERRIFDYVYSDRALYEVVAHENPDFLARHSPASRYFGIEVTEYFVDESSARLERISEYSTQLLAGARFKHKKDAKHLNVTEVDILRADGSTHAKNIPAIIHQMPPLAECSRQVADRIVAKAKRLDASVANVSHVNLIVEDRTGLLRTVAKKDFYRVYFAKELIDAITSSNFREVFVVTMLQDELVCARLKMLHLLAEVFLFNGALESSGLSSRIPNDVDELELFASYFNSLMQVPVLFHRDSSNVADVIFGDSGIVINDDRSLGVRLHSDLPISANATAPSVDWQSICGVGFHDTMKSFREAHSFSTEAVFPVNALK